MKKCLSACLLLLLQHAAMAAIPQSPLAARFSWPLRVDSNAVVKLPEQSMIALIGEIAPDSVDSLTRILPGASAPTTLYIDSGGGDMRSALRLANFVRDHDIRVVVVGRCFSACAHYVFSGARRKEATPGSLVGIHSKRFYYQDGDKILALNTSVDKDRAKIMAEPVSRRQYGELLRLEREFYAKAGIASGYHDAYAAFDAARSPVQAANCRNVDLWILSRSQLEAMGVKGFGAFWAPASAAEARNTAVKLGLAENRIFFGSPAELAALCKPTLMERLRALF